MAHLALALLASCGRLRSQATGDRGPRLRTRAALAPSAGQEGALDEARLGDRLGPSLAALLLGVVGALAVSVAVGAFERVKTGRVDVRDFRLRKTIRLRAGKRSLYLAKAT